MPRRSQISADVPDGWTWIVREGGLLDDPSDLLDDEGSRNEHVVRIGRTQVPIPERFWLGAYPPGDQWRVALQYVVVDGEVTTPMAKATRTDVSTALDELRRAWPLRAWMRHAVGVMVKDMVTREINREAEEYALNSVLELEPSARLSSFHQAEEWGWRLHRGKLDQAMTAVEQLPLGRRRNRITDAHLLDVARVYSAADEAGLPPTQAVAAKFHAAPSTAATWAGLARERFPDQMPPIRRGRRKQQTQEGS
jgi:hypothetical protein